MNSTRLIVMLVACTFGAMLSMTANAQLIVAHRGASHDAPENTLAAFRLAWEEGADAIETDLYLTKDGQIACIHDANTKRTGDKNLDVAGSTLAELRTVDVGAWKGAKFAGERIPTLSEILAIVPPGKTFFIEVKCGPEILPVMERTLAEHPSVKAEQLRIISFHADVIAQAKRRLPRIKNLWLASYKQDKATKAWSPTRETILKTLKETKTDGFNSQANLKFFTPEFVKELKGMGYDTGAWTIDDPAVAKEVAGMGVGAITTNRPAYIREQLGQAKR